jgi:hypothetical protein
MVNFLARFCECGVWTIKKRPCVHAIALWKKAMMKFEDIYGLVDPHYLASTGLYFFTTTQQT